MKRREFILALGGAAAAWPLAARAQQPTPVIGYLNTRGPDDAAHLAAAFRRGLRDGGFIDGQNVRIEFRWGRGRFDALKAMAEELCRVPVSVLAATGGDPAVLAAKAATSAIPIVSWAKIEVNISVHNLSVLHETSSRCCATATGSAA